MDMDIGMRVKMYRTEIFDDAFFMMMKQFKRLPPPPLGLLHYVPDFKPFGKFFETPRRTGGFRAKTAKVAKGRRPARCPAFSRNYAVGREVVAMQIFAQGEE
jgi:hypothetical protein